MPTSSNGEDRLFNTSCRENWIFTCKRMKLDPYLRPYTKFNSKWIIYLHIRTKPIKLLEENIGQNLHGNDFWDMKSKAQTTKDKTDKLDWMKVFFNFAHQKTILTK